MKEGEFREWEALGGIREKVLKKLESARESKLIGNSLEAMVSLQAPSGELDLLRKYSDNLASLLIVSAVEVGESPTGNLEVSISRAPWDKCERCWNFSDSVEGDADTPKLCKRCREVVAELGL
jgi:isoleucyl-tRNA synthetase